MKWKDKELNILLIDSSKDGYKLICGMLAEIDSVKLNLDWIETYEAGLKTVGNNLYDACLVNYQLGTHNGVDFIRQATSTGCQTPLILLMEQKNKDIGLAAAAAGAADHITKDQLGPLLLERSIHCAIGQKRAGEELRQGQERFQVALRHAPIVVFNQDTNLRYTWIYNPDPSFQRETVLGKTDNDLMLPEDAQRVTKIKHKVLKEGKSAREQVRITLDNQIRFYDFTVEPLRGSTGEIIGLTCATMDITNHKQAEKDLRETHDELERRVIERTTELAIANTRLTEEVIERQRLEKKINESLQRRARQVQTSTDIAQESATAAELDELFRRVVNLVQDQFGYYHAHVYALEGDDLIMKEGTGEAGQRMKDLNHKIPLDAERSLVAQAAREREPVMVSDVYKEANWLPNPLLPETKSELAIPIKLGDDVLGVLDVQNDTEDSLNQEDQILLMGLCGQIAVAINTRRLEAKRKLAEEAQQKLIEELDAFAHTVGYNLRDPLDLVIGYTNLLKEQARLPEELQEYLNAIARNGHKMSDIIDELEMLTGVRKADVVLKPLNMGRIVAEVQHRLAYLIQEYQAKIIVSEFWPTALGHKPWVEEVWANYLSNAIKYGGHPPLVRIGATAQSDGMIRFWIRDNGPGLTSEEQIQLFGDISGPHHIKIKGYILGLSIVRRITAKLGGQTWVESDGISGHGSVFSFTLPSVNQKIEQI